MASVTTTVEVPEELAELLSTSKLSSLSRDDQVRVALAIHLFVAGEVSIGKASELSGMGRVAFADLLVELGIPTVIYDQEEYERDLRTLDALEKRRNRA